MKKGLVLCGIGLLFLTIGTVTGKEGLKRVGENMIKKV